MSRAKEWRRVLCLVMAWPPYLTTTVLLANCWKIGQSLNQRMGLLHMLGHVHRVAFPHSSTAIRRSEAGKQWLQNVVTEVLALDNPLPGVP